MRNSKDTIAYRTRDFPVCNALSESTATLLIPVCQIYELITTGRESVLRCVQHMGLLIIVDRQLSQHSGLAACWTTGDYSCYCLRWRSFYSPHNYPGVS